MLSEENLLSFLDFLDLDETLIDSRLKTLMNKEHYTNKHLVNVVQLLHYKLLINLHDNSECDNDAESEFAAKLIKEIDRENIDIICKIISLTLALNGSTLVNRCEHLIQQVLLNIDISITKVKNDLDEHSSSNALFILKITDSALDAVIKDDKKMYLPFLEVPIDKILFSSYEHLKIHFLSSTVPKLFQAVIGYNILDSIWEVIKDLNGDDKEIALKVLSSLSDYYLPSEDSKNNTVLESNLINRFEFWSYVLYGLSLNDLALRKISIYLAKRALDCVICRNKDICVQSHNQVIFKWNQSETQFLKTMWNNFFILIDSLEEKQSNIVLPSLQLFAGLNSMGSWLNCAFNIGLKHDNTLVKYKCIQYRLQIKLSSEYEAMVLLKALNDTNIYDNIKDLEKLKISLFKFITHADVFRHIFKTLPLITWSPVPLYHIINVIKDVKLNENFKIKDDVFLQTVIDILKVPCNNVLLRKAIHINMSYFVGNNSIGLHWKDYINIYLHLPLQMTSCSSHNLFLSHLSKLSPNKNELKDYFQSLLETHLHIDFLLLYLARKEEEIPIYTELLFEKANIIDNVLCRQYSDKTEYLNHVIYLTQLFCKTKRTKFKFMETINSIISLKCKSILKYVLSLLADNATMQIEDMNLLCSGLKSMCHEINGKECTEELIQLYKSCVLFVSDKNTNLESMVFSLFIIDSLSDNPILLTNYKHEMLSLQKILMLTTQFENKQSIGRLRNVFFEKSCTLVDGLLKEETDIDKYLKDIVEYIQIIIECGGYGCLGTCIKITYKILPLIIRNKDIRFDTGQFISRLWKEIEELKSSNQYTPCILEFVNLITSTALLQMPMYSNTVILFCKKIIDYGLLKTTPLFYLIKKLNDIKYLNEQYGHIICILCDILLYCPLPRKDQRIAENLMVTVLQDDRYGLNLQEMDTHFYYQIQCESVLALSKIDNPDILTSIQTFITCKVNEAFKSKQRYHGHSQAHRLLLTALQHLLLMVLLKPNNNRSTQNWCLNLLGQLPHQPSVRICLEWYISLHFCIENTVLNEEAIQSLSNIPLISQFMILYWTVKHKILNSNCSELEYNLIMDLFMSHTMGQVFSIRLHAQYLASKLYEMYETASSKYTYSIEVIRKTFKESAKDKNFVKLKQDYYVNDFDIVKDLTPYFLYYLLLKSCEINNNESVDIVHVKSVLKAVTLNINGNVSNDFLEEWNRSHRSDDEVFAFNSREQDDSKDTDSIETVGTIQKKYIPWKNMSDINVYETEKKREPKSDLIVVASLIDKLPNLGGMARTNEVFGVKTYVVDSLRHLQDKQFQTLSVSAERWIDVEEVRPGLPLKQYLMTKKSEGYSLVAAEQTSTSCKLQAFKFPRKTLLLLGHEKEGIPCDLLPVMDFCVEIPQQGFVRSLNVHVTAAIFVWEYARQNIL